MSGYLWQAAMSRDCSVRPLRPLASRKSLQIIYTLYFLKFSNTLCADQNNTLTDESHVDRYPNGSGYLLSVKVTGGPQDIETPTLKLSH